MNVQATALGDSKHVGRKDQPVGGNHHRLALRLEEPRSGQGITESCRLEKCNSMLPGNLGNRADSHAHPTPCLLIWTSKH